MFTPTQLTDRILCGLYRMGVVNLEKIQQDFSGYDISNSLQELKEAGLIEHANYGSKIAYEATEKGNKVVTKYNDYSIYKNLPNPYPSIKGFKSDLLNFLNTNSGNYVNIKPVIDNYAPQFPDEPEAEVRRQAVSSKLKDLSLKGWIEIVGVDYMYLANSVNNSSGQMAIKDFQYKNIEARITDKGEEEYFKSKEEIKPANTINLVSNYGVISQDSDLRSFENRPNIHPINPPPAPHKNIVSQLWHLISNNPLISAIVAGLVILMITILLKHFGIG